ncbi:MAG: hypothetical protein U9Q18_02380 [Caldisericota bacterium]|nr:hypothetical protein [Caldisericota bacterium]
MISSILNNRIENLKDRILDVEPDKRNELIEWIKEYKLGVGLLKEICKDNDEKDPTGI